MLGNVATQTELAGAKTYSYDKVQRLTGAQQTTPAPAAQVESYTYDPAGNRIASHISAAITVDDADRTLDDGINSYGWNANGALISRAPKDGSRALTFQYDWMGARNQSQLRAIPGVVGFQYDPLTAR